MLLVFSLYYLMLILVKPHLLQRKLNSVFLSVPMPQLGQEVLF